ncbi:MAG: MerR family transcriptional regulator [Crocinitomicaceae bacterium]|jgi:DNA-binding transcriptional MerR regulator|nr:MerR family transcriptional regulator [Crocinitomicaceae bacterium]
MAEYKIKDLENLTGIKSHTIRIWEKRYSILSPDRTDTKIRTYTDDELTHLLTVSMLNRNGIKISKIAKLEQEDMNKLLWDIKVNKEPEYSMDKLILALVSLDEELFKGTMNGLIDKYGLEKTFVNHLIPFLDRIGIMWLIGTINPSQEHFMSNLIRQKIISEIDKQPIPKEDSKSILMYLPEHEWHEISLLFYQFLLRAKGVHTSYLGQSLPYPSLLESIEKLKPHAILSSWLTAVDKKFVVNYFKQLNKDLPDMKVFAGGAQIKANSKDLKGLIIEVQDIPELLEHL